MNSKRNKQTVVYIVLTENTSFGQVFLDIIHHPHLIDCIPDSRSDLNLTCSLKKKKKIFFIMKGYASFNRSLLVIHFKYSSVYMIFLKSLSQPPNNHKFVFCESLSIL